MAKSVKMALQMNSVRSIVTRLKLAKGGAGQQFFTNEVARLCDPYIPMQTGMLKNNKDIAPTYIEYQVPYATRQYYENKGRGLRGPQWDKRMWADRGKEIEESLSRYLKGGF